MDTMEVLPDPKDFDLLTVIGRGCNNCATVSLSKHRQTGNHVAIKRINLDQCDLDFSMIQHEVLQHKLLNHPNILQSMCSFVHNNEVWIVTPLMGYGSCRDLLQAHFSQGFPEPAIACILRDVLMALEYLHKRGIIHRSVRASHILLSSTGQVCLSGVRYSFNMMETGKRVRAVHDFPNQYVGSLLWASPELLEQNLSGYDTKADIYSIGITACELANSIVPFSEMPFTQMLLEKIQGVMPKILDTSTMSPATEGSNPEDVSPFNRTFSSHFHNFVEMCLQSDPELRPSASALLQHAFFKQIKRKSQVLSLPELLLPVQPLTQLELPKDESMMDDLAQAIGGVAVQEEDWEF